MGLQAARSMSIGQSESCERWPKLESTSGEVADNTQKGLSGESQLHIASR